MEQLLLEFALFGDDTLSDVVALGDEQIHVPFGIAHGFQRKVDAMQSPIRPRMCRLKSNCLSTRCRAHRVAQLVLQIG